MCKSWWSAVGRWLVLAPAAQVWQEQEGKMDRAEIDMRRPGAQLAGCAGGHDVCRNHHHQLDHQKDHQSPPWLPAWTLPWPTFWLMTAKLSTWPTKGSPPCLCALSINNPVGRLISKFFCSFLGPFLLTGNLVFHGLRNNELPKAIQYFSKYKIKIPNIL